MPLGARNRVQIAIRAHESRRRARWRRWVPAASFVAGAALVLVAVGSQWRANVSPAALLQAPVAVASVPTVGPFHVEGSDCTLDARGGRAELGARCSLVASHMTVQVFEPATVRAEGRNVEVTSGKILFEVEDVRQGEDPIEIRVSHGTIEVVGTRFAVEQQPEGGHVDLLEGKIRFHRPDGSVEDVLPGQRLAWGTEDADPTRALALEPDSDEIEFIDPDPAPDQHKPSRARGTDRQAAAVIERVTELRADKRYGAAITELRRALRRPWDRRTAQVLSYELGELLRAAEDSLGACEHFASHQRRYPEGRYAAAVDRILERLDCE